MSGIGGRPSDDVAKGFEEGAEVAPVGSELAGPSIAAAEGLLF